MSMTILGKGVPSYAFPSVRGAMRHFRSPADVIASLDGDLESTVAFVASGGTHFPSPILGRLGGVVCLDGPSAHLAIVSREFEVPRLVRAELADGTEVFWRSVRRGSRLGRGVRDRPTRSVGLDGDH